MVVVLNNIRSVHNVGSIFRTSDGAGVKKVYLCGITPTPYDRFGRIRSDFVKVSLGAEKKLEWEYNSSLTKTIEKLKKDGFEILFLEQSKKMIKYDSLKRIPYKKDKRALVLGNEVKGIPPKLFKKADKVFEIPMRGSKESLNVSVAFGVVVYHLLK